MGNLFSDNNENLFREVKEIKAEYFPLINEILRNNYDEGLKERRIKNNMLICLEPKCFDEIYDSDEKINPSYIHWLDYLYNYLSSEQSNKRDWATEMLQQLDEEPFLTETKYLSNFFFKEFYINNQPKCIKDSKEDDIDTSNNEMNDEINNEDLKTSLNNSNFNVMRNLGGTFMANSGVEIEVDANNSIHENEADVELKYKTFRNKVKKYIYIFKEHIIYKDHPINKVIQIFEKAWVDYVEKKMVFLNNFDDTEYNNYNVNATVDELTRELQNFVIKMQICLKLFYCKTIDYSCFVNEKDELMNLLTTLIFRTGKIYETIFKLQKIKLKANIDDMNNKYFQFKDITPQQLGIEKQFCLNEETFDLQEDILLKKEKEGKGNEGKKAIINDEEDKQKKDIDKGVVCINLSTDEIMDERKINSLLADIKNKKTNFQNYIENDTNMKVDIDFDVENTNLLFQRNPSDTIKVDSVYEESNIGSIIPQSKMTIDNEQIFQDDFSNKGNVKNNEENNININININEDNENDNRLIIRDNKDTRNSVTPFNCLKVFNRVSFYKDPDKSDIISLPYETAIQLLKQIEKYKAPFEKMLIFASLGNEIKNCIDDFWKEMEDYIEKDLLAVEAEQLMTIFIYIISKARIKDIVVHCKLIQLFSTSMTKSSMIGYYYSNAEASVTFIQSLKNVKELIKGSGSIFDKNDNCFKSQL